MSNATIRRFVEDDFEAAVALWHETNRATYTYNAAQQQTMLSDARRALRDDVLARCEVWIAEDAWGPVGMMAIDGCWIKQLCVLGRAQRRGVGALLVQHAKRLSPEGLSLYTFQKNEGARAFYERLGFVVVGFGVSPMPENEPDVEYRWEA